MTLLKVHFFKRVEIESVVGKVPTSIKPVFSVVPNEPSLSVAFS